MGLIPNAETDRKRQKRKLKGNCKGKINYAKMVQKVISMQKLGYLTRIWNLRIIQLTPQTMILCMIEYT